MHSIFQIHISRITKCADKTGFPRPGHIFGGANVWCFKLAGEKSLANGQPNYKLKFCWYKFG